MNQVIRLPDEFYILATASAADESRVLKQGDSFGIFDHYGDVLQFGLGEQGIYHEGTRFLSLLEFRIGNVRPFLLSSMIKEDNVLFTVDLTNPDVYVDGTVALRRGDLHILRSKFIWQATCYERLQIINYSLFPIELSFAIRFDADFADIFEVRGVKRERRGTRLEDEIDVDRVTLSYLGLDEIIRQTRIEFSPAPEKLATSEAFFQKVFAPKKHEFFLMTYSFGLNHCFPVRRPADVALHEAEQALESYKGEECHIHTSNHEFNGWLARSYADIHMMITETEHGLYPYAGVPWFSTVFGRDGIITAWELLWIFPRVAKGVLKYLAATQATEVIFERDAEPGKMLHETRRGEMAGLDEIPFDCYYGSTDSTPLFIMLAGAYFARTNDLEFMRSIWPHIQRALQWIEVYGDVDGDGFIETMRHSSHGLVQQGWKDSWDSVSHQDGSLAQGPLALCEVQGYVYAAKHAAARMAAVLGLVDESRRLFDQAERLKNQFNEAFWCDDLGTYAIALDYEKRPCKVKASNAGHCLFAGIATPEYASRTARTLMSEDSFSGWGIRTLSTSAVRYNPMSYHNGSVWPHDNAVIAAGFARYGFQDLAGKIISGFFDASVFFDSYRLPELFCGFPRREGEGPTRYPVACAPQAWAAGSVFLMLQACLGLAVHATESKVYFETPLLPGFVEEIHIKNLKFRESLLDVVVDRSFRGIGVERREGDASIVIS
ncbi:MAG: amylo-alpha-1,6-glucosidase [Candidatus Binatia bacterium]